MNTHDKAQYRNTLRSILTKADVKYAPRCIEVSAHFVELTKPYRKDELITDEVREAVLNAMDQVSVLEGMVVINGVADVQTDLTGTPMEIAQSLFDNLVGNSDELTLALTAFLMAEGHGVYSEFEAK